MSESAKISGWSGTPRWIAGAEVAGTGAALAGLQNGASALSGNAASAHTHVAIGQPARTCSEGALNGSPLSAEFQIGCEISYSQPNPRMHSISCLPFILIHGGESGTHNAHPHATAVFTATPTRSHAMAISTRRFTRHHCRVPAIGRFGQMAVEPPLANHTQPPTAATVEAPITGTRRHHHALRHSPGDGGCRGKGLPLPPAPRQIACGAGKFP